MKKTKNFEPFLSPAQLQRVLRYCKENQVEKQVFVNQLTLEGAENQQQALEIEDIQL